MQEEGIRMNINLPYMEGTSEKLPHTLRSAKKDPFSTPKAFCINYFVNQ